MLRRTVALLIAVVGLSGVSCSTPDDGEPTAYERQIIERKAKHGETWPPKQASYEEVSGEAERERQR